MARSALAAASDGMVLDITKRPVAAAAFASFFGDSERVAARIRTQTADIEIRLQPAPLSPSEKPQEVFISYAWGDETPQGMIRQQAVEGLYVALATDGFQPVRDREQIQAGELISAFIRRLTRADLIVAVISDRYLRSPYCMYEIYRLWQRHQGDSGDLAQHLLRALVRDPKLRPGHQSWKEVRLVEEFSLHVDDILVFVQNVLMPRNLEAHLDGNFEIVLTALRRRMTARKPE
ncbi:MAG TPA: toll/interleukin-1 receptor domain-containing protein [Thermoanaerobaculia bacterium]|nr:toll/interleukin-1 receptor domain-containing protein [Thermoanaerobaculia bacterium]